MDLKDKLNHIFSFAGKAVPTQDKALSSEAQEFIANIKENLDNKVIAYAEAVARIRKYSKNALEQSTMIFKIDNFEFTKTASVNGLEEVKNPMAKKISQEIQELKDKYSLSVYADWMTKEYKKVAYHLGTGDEIDSAKYDVGADAFEQKHQNTTTKEGESEMKQHEKERDTYNRASLFMSSKLKQAGEKAGVRVSEEPNHDQWDNKVLQTELADAKKNEGVGTKLVGEMDRMRKEYLRAADVKVTLTADFKDPRKSTWNISDAETGELLVQAAIGEDILDGANAPAEVVNDVMTAQFGKMLEDKIDQVGLVPVAIAMVGEANFKIAKDESKADKEKEEKEEKKEEKKDAKASESNEVKITKTESIDSAIGSVVKQASSVVKYYTLKGMLADAKLTFGEAEPLVRSAESKIQELGLMITAGAEDAEIDKKTEEVSEDLSMLDEKEDTMVGELEGDMVASEGDIEGAEELNKEESETLQELKAAAEAGDFEKVKELADKASEENKEEEKEEEKAEKEAKKAEKSEKKEEKTEEPSEEKEEKVVASTVKTIKTAASDKLYDLTNTNFQKEFHGGSKAKGDLAGIHNIWEVKKALEGIVNKKPNGKLASLYAKAAAGDSGARAYFSKIYGDPAYVAALFGPNSVEKQEAAQNKDGFQADFSPKQTQTQHAALETVEKTKKAFKMAMDMQSKGLLKEGSAALDKQVNSFINMDSKSLTAYSDSLENLSPTTAVEEGRFRVAVLERPMIVAQGKCIAAGFVDDKFVGYLTETELNASTGRITKANLSIGVGHLRTALDNGMLDGILSGGKSSAKDAEDVNVSVGQTDKPMSSKFDIGSL